MKPRYLSQTFGMPIISSHGNYRVGRIRDILVDHETGNIAAFMLAHHGVVLPQDVLVWKDYLLIHDETHISPLEDIVRVKAVFDRHIPIFGKRVVTEGGLYVGHVYDLEFNPELFCLKNLHTAKIFFIFKFQERIIPAKQIIQVKKKAIIIKDPLQKKRVKESVIEKSLSPAT